MWNTSPAIREECGGMVHSNIYSVSVLSFAFVLLLICFPLTTHLLARLSYFFFFFFFLVFFSHYENTHIQLYWKFHHQKLKVFRHKFWYVFNISAQNIDCRYSLEPPPRGGSNEYPQAMFLSRNKKNNVYPCKPQFYYIKVEFNGVKII